MAIKPLQSITFPGLPDTYKVPSTPEEVGAAPMAYVQQVGSPRNLLDNSDFTNPINQRGQTNYTAAGSYTFTIDRWKMNYGTVTVNDGYINWTTSEEAQYKKLIQIIPYTLKAGQTYTLAMLARVNQTDYSVLRFADNSGGGLSGASVILSTTNDFTWFIISYNMSKDLVQPRVEILTGSEISQNINVDIKAIALYEGEYTAETLPAYQPKGYAAELMECQRYFLNIAQDVTITLFTVMAYTTTQAYLTIPIPIKMRIDNPTISYTNMYLRSGQTDIKVSTTGDPQTYGNSIYVRVEVSSGLTKADFYMIRLITGSLSFSADL